MPKNKTSETKNHKATGKERVKIATRDVIKITPIIGDNLNVDAIVGALSKAALEESEIHAKMLHSVTDPWSTKNRPKYYGQYKRTPATVSSTVQTSSRVFVFLNLGTRRQPRVSMRAWSPRTFPRVFKSYTGRRSLSAVIAGQYKSPGVKAREWTDEIARVRQREFPMVVFKHLGDAAARAFSGVPSTKPVFPARRNL